MTARVLDRRDRNRPAAPDPQPPPIPWRPIVRAALAGTVVMVLLVLVDVERHSGGNPVSLVQPGASGPAAAVVHHDFPQVELPGVSGSTGSCTTPSPVTP